MSAFVPPISERERTAQREAWVRTRLRESFSLVALLEVVWEAWRLVSDAKQGTDGRTGTEALEEALIRAEKK